MAAPAILLGIDVAADGIGLVAIGGDGKILAALRRTYANDDGTASASEWWRAARTGIKELLRRGSLRADQIRAIGLTGDGDAVVAVDKAGEILATSPFGADPRCAVHLDEVLRKGGARNLANITGGPVTAASGVVKLQWMRANHKRAWHDCNLVLAPKDFLRLRLTGTAGTDAADACATGLFNPKSRAWSKQILQTMELNPAWFPAITTGNAMAGRVTESAGRDAGLQSGTPVVTGAGHAAAIAVAAGVLDATSTLVELGDGGAVVAPTIEALRDAKGRLRTSCHAQGGLWTVQTAGCATSAPLDWILERVMTTESTQARRNGRPLLELLSEIAAEIPAGSDGLNWLPGEVGSPGGFLSLRRDHGRGHLARAAFEGGVIAARQAVAAADELRGTTAQVVLAGRGCSSSLWAQLAADAIGRPVQALPVEEPAAVGTAILAATAVGAHKQLEDAVAKMARGRVSYQPRKASADALVAVSARQDALRRPVAPIEAEAAP
jgi:xylulokinase